MEMETLFIEDDRLICDQVLAWLLTIIDHPVTHGDFQNFECPNI